MFIHTYVFIHYGALLLQLLGGPGVVVNRVVSGLLVFRTATKLLRTVCVVYHEALKRGSKLLWSLVIKGLLIVVKGRYRSGPAKPE